MSKENKNHKSIPVENSVGKILMHDITQVVSGKKKGPAFKKGHVIKEEDIELLKDLGKENIYAFNIPSNSLHENDAAEKFKEFAGDNLEAEGPSEGKISFRAVKDGLTRISKEKVDKINRIGDIALTTIHSDIPVKKGDSIAGVRAIPLIVEKNRVEKAIKIAGTEPVIDIKPFVKKKVALIVTGSEIASGRIKDGFRPVIEKKVASYNSSLIRYALPGDSPEKMKEEIEISIDEGAELIILTGGMSVDPDDRTKEAIESAGVDVVSYGVPVLPGNMFMVGYIGDVAVFGVPACALFYDITALDIFLPYIFSDTRIKEEAMSGRGYGGFCRHCDICVYPRCALGKI